MIDDIMHIDLKNKALVYEYLICFTYFIFRVEHHSLHSQLKNIIGNNNI